MVVDLLVEGVLDEAVGRRLIEHAGHDVGTCYGKQGIGYIRKKVQGFNKASSGLPILTLADFCDLKEDCPPACVQALLPHRNEEMLLRIVVNEIESWVLADGDKLTEFLRVSEALVPIDPENVADPKQALVNLARKSKSGAIRDSIVPEQKTGAIVGPLYNSELSRFVSEQWRPSVAAAKSPSLASAIHKLTQL